MTLNNSRGSCVQNKTIPVSVFVGAVISHPKPRRTDPTRVSSAPQPSSSRFWTSGSPRSRRRSTTCATIARRARRRRKPPVSDGRARKESLLRSALYFRIIFSPTPSPPLRRPSSRHASRGDSHAALRCAPHGTLQGAHQGASRRALVGRRRLNARRVQDGE